MYLGRHSGKDKKVGSLKGIVWGTLIHWLSICVGSFVFKNGYFGGILGIFDDVKKNECTKS